MYLASFRINYGASLSLLVDNLPRMSVFFLFFHNNFHSISVFLQNELFLFKDFLVCHNVGNQACNHQCYRAEVYNVHIVPTQEVAEDDEDCANDENYNSCDF